MTTMLVLLLIGVTAAVAEAGGPRPVLVSSSGAMAAAVLFLLGVVLSLGRRS